MTVQTDAYPTRQKTSARDYMVRVDPVVYPSLLEAGEGPLDDHDLRCFEEKGYLHLSGLLSPDYLATLNQEAKRMRDHADRNDDRVVVEPTGDQVRSIFAIHQQSDIMADLMRSETLAPIARQLLGGDVYLHQTRLNFKPGFEGKEFYWHSDFETWHSEDGMPRMRALSCVVALDENMVHNGPLMIVPGSHKLFIPCPGETPENHFKKSLRKQEIGVPSQEALSMLVEKWGIDSMVGPPGTVVFFDCNAMHGSNGNITPHPRNNLFFVYNHVDNRLVAPYCGRSPRPEFIAHRK